MSYCCSTFGRATETGTDNEGYGPLISHASELIDEPGPCRWRMVPEWVIGDGFKLVFCPWCGVVVPPPDEPEPDEEDD